MVTHSPRRGRARATASCAWPDGTARAGMNAVARAATAARLGRRPTRCASRSRSPASRSAWRSRARCTRSTPRRSPRSTAPRAPSRAAPISRSAGRAAASTTRSSRASPQRPEVAAASPVVELDAALANGEDTLRVLGIDRVSRRRDCSPAFVASAARDRTRGGRRRARSTDAPWLTPAAAARLQLREGRRHAAPRRGQRRRASSRVAGVLPRLDAGGEIAVIDIAAAQQRFGRLGTLSRIDLRLRPGVDEARVPRRARRGCSRRASSPRGAAVDLGTRRRRSRAPIA